MATSRTSSDSTRIELVRDQVRRRSSDVDDGARRSAMLSLSTGSAVQSASTDYVAQSMADVPSRSNHVIRHRLRASSARGEYVPRPRASRRQLRLCDHHGEVGNARVGDLDAGRCSTSSSAPPSRSSGGSSPRSRSSSRGSTPPTRCLTQCGATSPPRAIGRCGSHRALGHLGQADVSVTIARASTARRSDDVSEAPTVDDIDALPAGCERRARSASTSSSRRKPMDVDCERAEHDRLAPATSFSTSVSGQARRGRQIALASERSRTASIQNT